MRTPIVIIGAGPAGAATALRLSYQGIPSVLIDRADFPRDKICGDALSGKVPVLLDRLDPAIMDRFRRRFEPIDVWGIRFAFGDRMLELPFKAGGERTPDKAPGYVSKRMNFDHFLIEEVRRRDNITLHLNTDITHWEKTAGGYHITDKDATQTWDCRLLIDATGAQSRFSRKEGGLVIDYSHHAGAVRAYYEGVTGFHEDNFIELHFVDEFNPGYFWIFPLPNGQANVGLGMRTDYLKRKKVNLRKGLDQLIASPQFRDRFKNARQIGTTRGFGLPLGSKERTLSGDNYLLVGDAGHLVDPVSGEGIGNAVYSAFIAADLAQKCLAENRFDAAFLSTYDTNIDRILRSELRLSYRMQQLLRYRWITNLLMKIVVSNPKITDVLSNLYTDFEFRKKLVTLRFWWKLYRAKPGEIPDVSRRRASAQK